MWVLVKFLWKFIGWLRHLIGPAIVILAGVIGYLAMQKYFPG